MAKKKSSMSDKMNDAIAELKSMFGEDVVTTLDSSDVKTIESIPTGSIGLDVALGIGGVPVGRVVEVYGNESSGKTSLAISIAREAQKKFPDKKVAYIDAEHAFDVSYAERIGLDTSNMLFSQPDFGEQAMDILMKFVESGAFSIVVVDSVTALTPKAEIEGDMTDQTIGLQARIMSKGLRKIVGPASSTGTTVLFINQLRANIGSMGYGPKEVTTGGKGLKFFSSVRIETKVIKSESSSVRVRAKVKKNKVAPPFREAEYDIDFGRGISTVGELLDYGKEHGLVKQSGSWFSYDGKSIGQGKDSAKMFLEENKDVYDKLYAEIKKFMEL